MSVAQGYTISPHLVGAGHLEPDMMSLISRLSDVADQIAEQHRDFILNSIASGLKGGTFRDALQKETNFTIDEALPGLSGGKSRYWRIITAHLHQYFASRYERLGCIRVIRESGHARITADLFDELHEHNLYPTRGTLKNIFEDLSRGRKVTFNLPPVPLDYAAAGDHLVKPMEISGREVTEWIQVGTSQFHEINFLIPNHIDLEVVERVSKPAFFIHQGELQMKFTVYMEVGQSDGRNILGCDLGRIKPITCAVVSTDGEFSTELAPSRELDRLSRKEKVLTRHLDDLHAKREHIGKLLAGQDDPDLRHIYEVLDQEYCSVKSKRTRLKHHSGFVAARDVVDHAVEQKCSTIKMEHLAWVDDGGKWTYADVQAKVEHTASKEGLKVQYVDAHGTSWEFPEEYAVNPAPHSEYNPNTRLLRNSSGETVDKDYSAAVAIGCRIERRKAIKKKKNPRIRVIQPKCCRDKFGPTPKRPRRRIRSGYAIPRKSSCHPPVGTSATVVMQGFSCEQVAFNSVDAGGSPPVSLTC